MLFRNGTVRAPHFAHRRFVGCCERNAATLAAKIEAAENQERLFDPDAIVGTAVSETVRAGGTRHMTSHRRAHTDGIPVRFYRVIRAYRRVTRFFW